MGAVDLLIAAISIAALFIAGLKFLEHSVYRDYENRSPAAHVLFSLLFALSAFMLELLVFENVGYMDSGWVK